MMYTVLSNILLPAGWVCGAVLLLAVLYVFAVKGRRNQPGLEKLKGFSYAHRGLHGEKIPENSMAAFQAALDKGYGIELDVHLTKDGQLVVIHDSDLTRCTGRAGKVENHTLEELTMFTLEGTEQTIPAFCRVLALYDGKAPLIIELKTAGGNHAKLTDRVMAEMENYKGVYCLESFDPRCLQHLKKHYPNVIRGQLTENYLRSKAPVPWIIKLAMTWQLGNFLFRPDFIAYRFADRKRMSNFLVRRLWKQTGVSWTLKTKEEYDIAVSEGWIPIFEGFEP